MANVLYGDLGSEKMIYNNGGNVQQQTIRSIYESASDLIAGYCKDGNGSLYYYAKRYNARGAGYVSAEYRTVSDCPSKEFFNCTFHTVDEFERETQSCSEVFSLIDNGRFNNLSRENYAYIIEKIFSALENGTTLYLKTGITGITVESISERLTFISKILSVLPVALQKEISVACNAKSNKKVPANIIISDDAVISGGTVVDCTDFSKFSPASKKFSLYLSDIILGKDSFNQNLNDYFEEHIIGRYLKKSSKIFVPYPYLYDLYFSNDKKSFEKINSSYKGCVKITNLLCFMKNRDTAINNTVVKKEGTISTRTNFEKREIPSDISIDNIKIVFNENINSSNTATELSKKNDPDINQYSNNELIKENEYVESESMKASKKKIADLIEARKKIDAAKEKEAEINNISILEKYETFEELKGEELQNKSYNNDYDPLDEFPISKFSSSGSSEETEDFTDATKFLENNALSKGLGLSADSINQMNIQFKTVEMMEKRNNIISNDKILRVYIDIWNNAFKAMMSSYVYVSNNTFINAIRNKSIVDVIDDSEEVDYCVTLTEVCFKIGAHNYETIDSNEIDFFDYVNVQTFFVFYTRVKQVFDKLFEDGCRSLIDNQKYFEIAAYTYIYLLLIKENKEFTDRDLTFKTLATNGVEKLRNNIKTLVNEGKFEVKEYLRNQFTLSAEYIMVIIGGMNKRNAFSSISECLEEYRINKIFYSIINFYIRELSLDRYEIQGELNRFLDESDEMRKIDKFSDKIISNDIRDYINVQFEEKKNPEEKKTNIVSTDTNNKSISLLLERGIDDDNNIRRILYYIFKYIRTTNCSKNAHLSRDNDVPSNGNRKSQKKRTEEKFTFDINEKNIKKIFSEIDNIDVACKYETDYNFVQKESLRMMQLLEEKWTCNDYYYKIVVSAKISMFKSNTYEVNLDDAYKACIIVLHEYFKFDVNSFKDYLVSEKIDITDISCLNIIDNAESVRKFLKNESQKVITFTLALIFTWLNLQLYIEDKNERKLIQSNANAVIDAFNLKDILISLLKKMFLSKKAFDFFDKCSEYLGIRGLMPITWKDLE